MLKKLVLVFSVLTLFIILVYVYFTFQVKEQKIDHIKDQMRLTINTELKKHKMDDLKIAILISKNKALVDALENDDEDLGYKILSDIVTSIEKSTDFRIRAQVLTNELNIFARSWDDVYAGMPIGDYREDLKYFETHTNPRTSVEIGRRLGIKATVPVYLEDGSFLGFVEVISFFKSMTEFFSSIGVDLYVLLDVKYTQTAVLMSENLVIDEYIVSNRNYNATHIQTLNTLDFKELELNQLVYTNQKYIFYETMYDGSHNKIGAYVFVLPQRYLDYFRDPEDDISFLINLTRSSLYDVIKKEKYEKNLYDKYSVDAMLYLQDVIDEEDRELFLDEAYEKFDEYSKDELIQMMLERRIVKKIDGKIK